MEVIGDFIIGRAEGMWLVFNSAGDLCFDSPFRWKCVDWINMQYDDYDDDDEYY